MFLVFQINNKFWIRSSSKLSKMSRKVIIKRQEDKFQWSQTEESLTFYLPLKNVSLKNIDVLITRDFIKVNASSIRYICVIDLLTNIDYEHPSTKVTLLDEKLEINVFKLADDRRIWETAMIQGLTKDEVRVRREASLAQYYQRQEEKLKLAQATKLAQDKHSID